MRIFLADSARHLGQNIRKCGFEIGQYESYAFADGERGYRLREDVRGESVVLIASVLPNPESLFEILAFHRLACENGARNTSFFVPYLGYARQDRPARPGEGSIGKLVIESLQKMNHAKLILFDVHSDLIRKTFRPFVTELSALPLISDALAKHPPDVIVSPDAGFVSRAVKLQKLLKPKPSLAVVEKVRPRPNVAIAKHLHGEVRGKDVLIVDDMIDTGGTLSQAVKLVSQNGAHSIRLAATHGIFSGEARERLNRLPIKEVLITNTLPQIRSPRIRILDISPLVAAALARI
ncbi:MAG TPA: ribose-phosphate diphosphokinase [Thermodesulfobacteriota bacterium]|jgi:ribose-phosphate pyrophosphokinase|nr:ribose-phosphate diphosphokinase [Thermodesulfobacteriota bacterium]